MILSNEVTCALKKHRAILRIDYSFQYEIQVYVSINIPVTEISPRTERNICRSIPMEQVLCTDFDLIGHNIKEICKELGILE